jgi:lipoprotein-anchoring transpeptidase ErfK/SrfK
MLRLLFALSLAASAIFSARAAPKSQPATPITATSVDAAFPNGGNESDSSLIAKAEALLDRAHFSPGEIDGEDGDNYRRALRAFQQAHSLDDTGRLDAETWSALDSSAEEPVLKRYTISTEDVAGPFVRRIPENLMGMARLPGLSYASPLAELAEKFRMSEGLLRKLNPHANFDVVGADIDVANVSPMLLRSGRRTVEAKPPNVFGSEDSEVETIVVDKPAHNVRAYDQSGRLLAFYPATIGSEEKPAPSGVFKVKRVDWNPDYVYDPKFAWKGIKATQVND